MIKNLVLVVLILCSYAIQAQDGALDATYGTNGFTSTDISGLADNAREILIHPDGSIWAFGVEDYQDTNQKVFVRYTNTGELDQTFGDNGVVRIGLQNEFNYTSIHATDDGSVIAAGIIFANGDFDFLISKYSANGVLDTNFGSSGHQIIDIGDEMMVSAFLQSDSIRLVGLTNNSIGFTVVFAQLLFNGTLDDAFGNGGLKTQTILSDPNLEGTPIEVLQFDEGSFLISFLAQDQNFSKTLRFTKFSNVGMIDASFGNNGIVITDTTHNWFTSVSTVILDNSEYMSFIHLAGENAPTSSQTFFAKYTANGSIDTSFGSQGFKETPFDAFAPQKVIRQENNRLLVFGGTYFIDGPLFTILRFYASGFVDTSFGGNGEVLIDLLPASLALQDDGKIVGLASTPWYFGEEDFVTLRLNNDQLSVAENTFDSLSLTPNPANFELQLNCESCTLNGRAFTVYDTTGKLIHSGIFNTELPTVDVSELATGMYYFQIQETTLKFIKK